MSRMSGNLATRHSKLLYTHTNSRPHASVLVTPGTRDPDTPAVHTVQTPELQDKICTGSCSQVQLQV